MLIALHKSIAQKMRILTHFGSRGLDPGTRAWNSPWFTTEASFVEAIVVIIA